LVSVLFAQGLTKLGRREDRVHLRVPLSVKEIHEFETRLEEQSVVSGWLLPRVQAVLTGVLGVGNEQAYLGRDGWLFYRPDVDYVTGRPFLSPRTWRARILGAKAWEEPPQPDPIPALSEFGRQLSERGIALVLVPTPTKTTIHPSRFVERVPPVSPQNPSYRAFLDAMRVEGIAVFDPTDVLLADVAETGRAQYLATDSHWTGDAMARVADALAAFLRSRVALSPPEPNRYVRSQTTVEGAGDIAAMLKLPDSLRFFPPERTTLYPVREATGDAWAPDPNAEALLLGDSFSNIYSLEGMGWGASAGFAEQLSWALGLPVDRIVVNAGGSHTARERLVGEMLRGNDRLMGKRVVVYQFAARELLSGDWKRPELPLFRYPSPVAPPKVPLAVRGRPETDSGASQTEEASEPPSETDAPQRIATDPPLRVIGELVEKSDPPKPGSVPYPDCLIALHLRNVRAETGAPTTDEIVVFTWGMREHRWTNATTLEVGKTMSLTVRPWSEVEREYGSLNRVELQNEAAWLLDAYWSDGSEIQ
jgi:alginate O-acetyltransferase complex protein AlgJ